MKFYIVNYKCRNCYATFFVKVPFMQEALNYFDCPRCGLSRLYKTDSEIDQRSSLYAQDGMSLVSAASGVSL